MPRPRTTLTAEQLEGRELPAAFQTLPVLPISDPATLDNARAVVALGQTLGRRTDAFMKVGDSNTSLGGYAEPQFLSPLGNGNYNVVASGLANYGNSILGTWGTFRSPVGAFGENSFNRNSTTAYPGWTIPYLLPNLRGEIAATNAGIALVMIGTNDLALDPNPETYRGGLRTIVSTLISAGVLPVLSTLPDHLDSTVYNSRVPAFNQVIADVGQQYHVPVWNLSSALAGLPGRGLDSGGVHLSVAPGGGGALSGTDLLYGQNVRNLEALQILDWFRTTVVGGLPSAVAPLTSWTPLPAGQGVYAVGRDIGHGPAVDVYDSSGALLNRFLAFEPTFAGGVRVATADVNGDGYTDLVAGPGLGGGSVVKVFSGRDGAQLASFFAFEPSFRTGVYVTAGDLDGDGKAEVVVGAGNGGGPAVAVFRGDDLAEVGRFFAYESTFRGGVNVALGTVAGFGPVIATGSGVGGGPVVKLFRYGSFQQAASFFVFEPAVRNGLSVAIGDLDGDGSAELVTAPAVGNPNVRVIDAQSGGVKASFFAGDAGSPAGVRLAVRRGTPGHADRLLVGNGTGGTTMLLAYDGLNGQPTRLPPDDASRAFGIYVG